ncbi:sensor histidine kinase [Winogradskya humida]|uniref:Sensor-like histidine kinase SenX3 n=1 Tax=Winogradskya humida TaxID=113566 RepID=A0ABQ4A6D2_9ACTN|nr:PAS domain-containing sensor histidine kinase [Actinoplanes humidus]GIE26183.1 hypothetical protein Ahu01nite_092850 [Actinoplanes humidus]
MAPDEERVDQHLLRRVRRLVPLLAVLVVCMGLTVLAGWMFGAGTLTRVIPDAASMKPVTAACVTILGLSLLAAISQRGGIRVAGTVGCAVVTLAATVTLLQYATGLDLGIDRLLFPESVAADRVATSFPGRMAPNTATAMLLLTGAQLAAVRRHPRAVVVSQVMCMVAAIVGVLGLYGYALSVSALQRFLGLTGMAVNTAAAVTLLAAGTFLILPEQGLARLAVSRGSSASLTRAMLTTATVVPFSLGWLCLRAQDAGRFDARLGLALLVTANVVAFVAVGVAFGSRAVRTELERDHSEILLGRNIQTQAAMDNMPEAVFIKDLTGRYAQVNLAFEKHFGAPSALTDRDLFGEADATRLQRYTQEALICDRAVRFEQVIAGRDYQSALFPLHRPDGSAYGICGVFTDVTTRKRAEIDLAGTAAALRSELLHRAEIEAELMARQADLKAFAYVVAHDLKGPLTAVTGFAEIVESDLQAGVTDPAMLVPNLERVRGGVVRMRSFIDDLLAYATARDAALRLETIDLEALVAGIVADRVDHLPAGPATRPDIRSGPLPAVHADPVLCRQLLDNLIGNAIKYTPPGRPATVRISAHTLPQASAVRIEVADRGIGIPAGQHERVFESFHRATTDSGFAGTGLGLAICRRVVERHDGTITVADNPGGGSIFRFTLPLAADPLVGAGSSMIQIGGLSSSAWTSGG